MWLWRWGWRFWHYNRYSDAFAVRCARASRSLMGRSLIHSDSLFASVYERGLRASSRGKRRMLLCVMLRWLLVPRLFCLVRIAFVSVSRNSLNDFTRFGSFLLLFDSNVGNLLSVFMLFTCAWCYALPCNFYLPHLSTYLTPTFSSKIPQ